MKKISLSVLVVSVMLSVMAAGGIAGAQQNDPTSTRSYVSFVPINTVSVVPGRSTPVSFMFHVAPGYHINSNKPTAPELIPTQLHFSLPGSDIVIGRIQYPAGQLVSFPFDPTQKLSVYSGDVVVKGLVVSPPSGTADTYTVHGELKYQACDNNACYPPRKLPFTFNVRVGAKPRGTRKARPNAQSPHIH